MPWRFARFPLNYRTGSYLLSLDSILKKNQSKYGLRVNKFGESDLHLGDLPGIHSHCHRHSKIIGILVSSSFQLSWSPFKPSIWLGTWRSPDLPHPPGNILKPGVLQVKKQLFYWPLFAPPAEPLRNITADSTQKELPLFSSRRLASLPYCDGWSENTNAVCHVSHKDRNRSQKWAQDLITAESRQQSF